jgi:hypothetical protein
MNQELELEIAWQRKLLPLMASMLVALTVFFCVAISVETFRIQAHIENTHEVDLRPIFATVGVDQPKTFDTEMELAQWRTMALLESNALQSRYHEATIALLIRICIVFLGFLTGMVLAVVGATFILGKLREAPSKLTAEAGAWKMIVTSASPGLVLAILGTVLMVATVTARIDVNVSDAALYLSSANTNAQRAATIRTQNASAAAPSEKPQKRSDLLKDVEEPK